MSLTATATGGTPNPTTPAFSDDEEWITAYLVIHMLSEQSRRYTYLLWVAIALVFLVFAILHWTGARGGSFGGYWAKWALRRRTWGGNAALQVSKKGISSRRQPISLPSNAQLLCLVVLFLATSALSFAGPDYIAPGLKLWQFHKREQSFDTDQFTPFQPQYTIGKAWWTSGGRTGLIAFALIPLCILFSLKAPPFALFAIPFMIQYHFDKLAWLHRWCGRLIWLMSALHVTLWSVQLALDHRTGSNTIAYTFAWQYDKFIYGWIAFGLLTLVILLSLFPLRRAHYETFYFLHVLLLPLTIVTSGLHHPPVAYWCWIALGLWAGERCWRVTWWLHVNGYFGGIVSNVRIRQQNDVTPTRPYHRGKAESWELTALTRTPPATPTLRESPTFQLPSHGQYSQTATSGLPNSPRSPHEVYGPRTPNYAPRQHSKLASPPIYPPSSSTIQAPYLPPPGYAHCEIVAGKTVRLRFITPGALSWAPGQHFLITMPHVSRVTSHPFTAASVCDESSPTNFGRDMVFLVRTKQGWTKDLWDTVVKLTSRGQTCPRGEHPPPGTEMPPHGVLMRMWVAGPFGSAIRNRWGSFSTVLVIVGGSGVSFGLSILQYVCMCLAGRDGRELGSSPGGFGDKSFRTTRVRFVWLIREFCHVQWCASILRRCVNMVDPAHLQIDVFVTNFKAIDIPSRERGRSMDQPRVRLADMQVVDDRLAPPTPGFSRSGTHSRSSSLDSHASRDSALDDDSIVDLGYYAGEYEDDLEQGDLGAHHQHLLGLTNFDGDDDQSLPGEDQLNRQVKKVGKVRRANTRRAAKSARTAHRQDHNTLALEEDGMHTHSSSEDAPFHGSGTKRGLQIHIRQPSATLGDIGGRGIRSPTEDEFLNLKKSSPVPDPRLHELQHDAVPSSSISMDTHQSSRMSVASATPSEASTIRHLLAVDETVHLEVEQRELDDVGIMAEHVRKGKPKVDRILEDEVRISNGAIVVACCGPASLNVMVRKAICSQIDPERIRRGDMRGSIALVSEEFEY